jgi:hypothetical protein
VRGGVGATASGKEMTVKSGDELEWTGEAERSSYGEKFSMLSECNEI